MYSGRRNPLSSAGMIREWIAGIDTDQYDGPMAAARDYYGREPTEPEYGRVSRVWYEEPARKMCRTVGDDDDIGMRKMPLRPDMIADLRAAANTDVWIRLPRWDDDEEAA